MIASVIQANTMQTVEAATTHFSSKYTSLLPESKGKKEKSYPVHTRTPQSTDRQSSYLKVENKQRQY